MSQRMPLLTNRFWRVPKGQVLWQPLGAPRPLLLGDCAACEITVREEVLDLRSNEGGTGVLVHQVPVRRDVTGRLRLRQMTEASLEAAWLGRLAVPARVTAPDQSAVLVGARQGMVFDLGARPVVVAGLAIGQTALEPGRDYLADQATGLVGLLAIPGGGPADVTVRYAVPAISGEDQPALGLGLERAPLGRLIVLGTRGVGGRLDIDLPRVRLAPAAPFALIADAELGGLDLAFTVLWQSAVPGGGGQAPAAAGYGTVQLIDNFAVSVAAAAPLA